MLPAQAPVRGVSILARDYPASARRALEETGAVRRAAPDPLPGIAETLRIYPDPKGARPLPRDHVDRELGQYPYGRCTRPPDAARAQELRKDVRPGDGALGVRRTGDREGRARAPGSGRAEDAGGRQGRRREGEEAGARGLGRAEAAFFTSPACGEVDARKRGGWGNGLSTRRARYAETPHPGPPPRRAGEGEYRPSLTSLWFPPSPHPAPPPTVS